MQHRQALPAALGEGRILGIRRENLSHAGFVPTAASATRIENMGDHQYVYLRVQGHAAPVVMKGSSHHRCAAGETIPVNVDTTFAHVFADGGGNARNLTLPEGFAQQQ